MKKVTLLTFLGLVGSILLSTAHAAESKLNHRYFGETKVDGHTRQIGLLTHEIPSEPGSYYGVLAEYIHPLEANGFIKAFVKPGEKNGYLTQLYHWVTIYKLVNNPGTSDYQLYKVRVQNGQIVAAAAPEAGRLTASRAGLLRKKDVAELTVTISVK